MMVAVPRERLLRFLLRQGLEPAIAEKARGEASALNSHHPQRPLLPLVDSSPESGAVGQIVANDRRARSQRFWNPDGRYERRAVGAGLRDAPCPPQPVEHARRND